MLNNILPVGSRARTIAFSALATAVALAYVQFVLPGTPGGGRGTPAAVLFAGFVTGCNVALISLGLLLVYRSLRVINFSQVAIGAVGGRLFFCFMQFTVVPFPIALVFGLATGVVCGVVFDLIIGRRFFNSPRVLMTTATIMAAGVFAQFLAVRVPSLPVFPRASTLSDLERLGGVASRPFLPFASWTFHVGKFPTDYGFAEVLNIELLVFAVLGVVLFLRYTRSGVAVRALAENSERASLLGIPIYTLSMIVWGIAGLLGTLAVIGIGALSSPAAGAGGGVSVVLLMAPLTAAAVARFQSIPTAVFTSLLFATVTQAVNFSYPEDQGMVYVGLLVILTATLLIQRKTIGRSEEGAGAAVAALREVRGIPKEMARIGTVRTTRWALIVTGALFTLVYPLIVPARFQELGAAILVQAIVGVSLVVLTGWAGQISLGQFAFAAVGAAVASSLTARVGVPFWFAVPIASAVAGGFAALIGIPALRLKGLFLGVTTLGLAIATSAVLFDPKYFGWMLPKAAVDRPTLFFLNFEQNRPMYYLCLACLVLAIVITVNLRRSRFGRLLIALRENEANVQSFGVSAVRLKLTAFAVSGALAGFSGAVFVHQQRGLSAESFLPERSAQVFIFTVLGGVGSVGGALLGSMYDNLFRYFLPSNDFLKNIADGLQAGGGPLLIFWVAPAGLISIAMLVRDSWLRIIAQRRQIVVPSLFADYDPDALERRLIPLADPDANSGLAALGSGVHFRLGSELHGGAHVDARELPARDEERLAIGAAVSSVGDVDAEAPRDVVGASMLAGVGEDE